MHHQIYTLLNKKALYNHSLLLRIQIPLEGLIMTTSFNTYILFSFAGLTHMDYNYLLFVPVLCCAGRGLPKSLSSNEIVLLNCLWDLESQKLTTNWDMKKDLIHQDYNERKSPDWQSIPHIICINERKRNILAKYTFNCMNSTSLLQQFYISTLSLT